MQKPVKYLFQFIPILSIWILLSFPYRAVSFASSILGKFMIVCIVAFYSYIDKYYGAFVVALVLLYYTYVDKLVYSEGFSEQLPNEVRKQFEEQYCNNGVLHFKNMNVKLDQIEHIFPEVVFHGNTCNPCDKNCDYNIIEYKPPMPIV